MRLRKPRGQAKTLCSKCGNPLEHSRHKKQRYCKPCHASYMKEYRRKPTPEKQAA